MCLILEAVEGSWMCVVFVSRLLLHQRLVPVNIIECDLKRMQLDAHLDNIQNTKLFSSFQQRNQTRTRLKNCEETAHKCKVRNRVLE